MIARISGGFTRVGTYLREVRDELMKVVWPSTGTVVNFTTVAIAMVLVISGFLFGLDQIFGFGLQKLLHL
jgi:preprotein translocase subunit SecE